VNILQTGSVLQRVSIAYTAVLAIGLVNPYFGLSVCPSQSRWYSVRMTQSTIMRSSLMIPSFLMVNSPRTFKGNIPRGSAKWKWGRKTCHFQPI